jgi:hypothetical protein
MIRDVEGVPARPRAAAMPGRVLVPLALVRRGLAGHRLRGQESTDEVETTITSTDARWNHQDLGSPRQGEEVQRPAYWRTWSTWARASSLRGGATTLRSKESGTGRTAPGCCCVRRERMCCVGMMSRRVITSFSYTPRGTRGGMSVRLLATEWSRTRHWNRSSTTWLVRRKTTRRFDPRTGDLGLRGDIAPLTPRVGERGLMPGMGGGSCRGTERAARERQLACMRRYVGVQSYVVVLEYGSAEEQGVVAQAVLLDVPEPRYLLILLHGDTSRLCQEGL